MTDRFRTVQLQIIADSEEEAQAALGVLDNNLPVFAFTTPRLNENGKYVAEATTEVQVEEIERMRNIIKNEKDDLKT